MSNEAGAPGGAPVQRSLWGQAVHLVYSALTPLGSELKQDKVVWRKLRIQVLDCRSGKPIVNTKVEEVKIDDGVAFRFLNTGGWDFVENFVIPANEQGPLSWKGFGPRKATPKESSIRLQKALKALGYLTSAPGHAMTDDAWAALERFQDAWYAAKKEPKPAQFVKAVENMVVQRIVAEYNQNFHRAVQVELTGLGYDCQSENGQWGPNSEVALANWQKVELATKEPFTTFNKEDKKAARLKLAGELKEARKNFFSDVDGIVHVAIPVAKIKSGFKLRIAFHDFAMVLEKEGYSRAVPKQKPTGFGIEWFDGDQDADGGSWCWRLRPAGNGETRSALPEFRSFLEIQVPPAPNATWRDLDQSLLNAALFSPFYESLLFDRDGDQPEFVVFALIWCQPVFDEIEDPAAPYNFTYEAYIDPGLSHSVRNLMRGRHMHIVTYVSAMQGGTKPHAGKGYGKMEGLPAPPTLWRREHVESTGLWGHPGIDAFAQVGDKIFALHAGKAVRGLTKGGGQSMSVRWGGDSISCLHFSEYRVATGEFVKAGQVIGLAGRTGNFSDQYDPDNAPAYAPPSRYPGHTHLNIRISDYSSAVRDGIEQRDPDNAVCLPDNDYPLLFPCACPVTLPEADPSACRFADGKFTDTCWAVAELRCPYMWNAGNGQSPFRLQAQLRYLFEQQGGDYVSPGHVDGELGPVPASAAVKASASRKAIRAFMAKHFQVSTYEMSPDGWAKLNELALVERPQTTSTEPE